MSSAEVEKMVKSCRLSGNATKVSFPDSRKSCEHFRVRGDQTSYSDVERATQVKRGLKLFGRRSPRWGTGGTDTHGGLTAKGCTFLTHPSTCNATNSRTAANSPEWFPGWACTLRRPHRRTVLHPR